MTKDKIGGYFDWIVKGFVSGTCATGMYFAIAMSKDITTILVRTEGIDKTVLSHEKEIDELRADTKELSARVYRQQFCCDKP